uniref:AraC family transcriptional regulator ligand-binding domain-containing protein n=1 Tax=Reinekea sp. TaxID=1970455 RepID=UPI002A7EFB3D
MTISLGDLSIRYSNLLLQTSQAIGIDTQAYCIQFQLSATKLNQPDGRLSIPKFMRLGQTLIADHHCPELGLLCAQIAQPSLLSWVGFLAECAPSLHQALTDMVRYETLSSRNARGHSRFYSEGPLAVAEFYSISPYNDFNHFIVDL